MTRGIVIILKGVIMSRRKGGTNFVGYEPKYTDSAGYEVIKTEDRGWIREHIYLWEKANGKVPKGYFLIFKDDNKKNASLTNLEMVKSKGFNRSVQKQVRIIAEMNNMITELQNSVAEKDLEIKNLNDAIDLLIESSGKE